MLKLQRNYRIKFEIGEKRDATTYVPQEEIYVEYPFTLHLDINRGIFNSLNTGHFRLLNLSRDVQARLWKDATDQKKYITMWLCAGYQDVMPLIFVGDIQTCYSYRYGGETEFTTEINASDALYLIQYGFANLTFNAGSSIGGMLEILLNSNPMVKVGYISPELQTLKKSQTFIGQTVELLRREFANYEVFIDNNELNIMRADEVKPSNVPVVYANSGLLGSPRRADNFLQCDMIFEPGLSTAQAIILLSDSLPFMNQTYKIVGIQHRGVISPVESGSLTTTITLHLGDKPLKDIQKWAEKVYNGDSSSRWSRPVDGAISSPFGARVAPTAGASVQHQGIDIACNVGSSVKAPANGRVLATGIRGGYGNFIQIDHGMIDGKRVTSSYAHLQTILVQETQTVSAGSIIALSGGAKGAAGSGTSTGPHLHFEIRENGFAVNPTKYIGG